MKIFKTVALAEASSDTTVMLKLSVWRANLDAEQADKFWMIVHALPASYVRALASSREAMASALGLSSPGEVSIGPDQLGRVTSISKAEIFRRGGEVFILAFRRRRDQSRTWVLGEDLEATEEVIPSAPGHLYLYALSGARGIPDVSEFIDAVEGACGASLKKWEFQARQFMELKQEGRQESLEITSAKVSASQLLAEKQSRVLATLIKSAPGGLILADIEKQLKRDKVDDVDGHLTALQECGLISSEYAVVCAKNQQQMARFADAEIVREMSQKGVRCGCGRKLEDERIEEAVAITDLGRELLDKSTWMSVLLTEELRNLGVPEDRIMMEYSTGGDEMDCIADINGEVILFELKDKEFSLREAYSFAAKVGLVQPRHPVIVTTEKVGGDAKEHFQKAEVAGRRSQVRRHPQGTLPTLFIEGMENLRPQLEELASSVHRGYAVQVLREVMPLAFISPAHVLDGIVMEP
ncbi:MULTISPECIES: hypothetical protein [Streptomyces]|nr:hypothetical protein [Streptomyces venezuelae]